MRTDDAMRTAAGSPAPGTTDVVCFDVAGCEYCIGVESVLGVNPLVRIRPVPGAPPFVRGVVDIRGRVIPVIGLRERLGAEAAEDDAGRRIVVARTDGGIAGMVVDTVTRVARMRSEDVSPAPPELGALDCVSGVARIGGAIVLVLDLDAVVNIDRAGPPTAWLRRPERANDGGSHGN